MCDPLLTHFLFMLQKLACLIFVSKVFWIPVCLKHYYLVKLKIVIMSIQDQTINDEFPKAPPSPVETLSTVSDIELDDVGSFSDYDIDYICKKLTHRSASFSISLISSRDSEDGNTDVFDDSSYTSQHDYYVSKQTSSTTTTTGDSGIDSSEKFY